MDAESEKQAAAEYAASLVEDGMAVGLGSGSTAVMAVRSLGGRVQNGLRITGVPTSEDTARLARELGIPLVSLSDQVHLDVAIDGADEVDPGLNLIKGHGGALLREKLVARAAKRYIVVVDHSKRVSRLGARAPVPVEVVPFGWTATRVRLEHLGFRSELRGGSDPFRTDSGNFILDCQVDHLINLAEQTIADSIKVQTGVVEHGLFLGIATTVVVGTPGGRVDLLQPQEAGTR